MSARATVPPGEQRPTFQDADKVIAEMVARVQKIVHEKSGLDLTADEVIKVHLLAMEPDFLARSIVFSLTRNPIDLGGQDDAETAEETAAGLPTA